MRNRVFSVLGYLESKIKYKRAEYCHWETTVAAKILDNPREFGRTDKSNMIQFCTQAALNYAESAQNSEKIDLPYSKPENIIIAGMGGSAIGGELLKDWACDKAPVPIEVSRAYVLPAYAN